MKARTTLASAVVLLALTAAVVSLVASPAFAANCGGSQGQALLLGCNLNSATGPTSMFVSVPPSSGYAFEVTNSASGSEGIHADAAYALVGDGTIYGVTGRADTYGVYGDSASGTGVYGNTTAEGQNGVHGHANNAGGSGVYGENDNTGYGVAGRAATGTGVLGDSQRGVGVDANSTSGTALQVNGRATFSTAGRATVVSGKKSVTVNLSGVTASDVVLATVQGSGAFFVKNAVAGSGQFTISINKAPASPKTVTVGYFVLN